MYITRELNWHVQIEESEEEVEPIVMPIVEYVEIISEDNADVINIEEMPEVDEYNEADFIIPEDEEWTIWEVNYDYEEVEKVLYAPVTENIMANLPQGNKDETCVVCRDDSRTHALIPCGHRVLCVYCIWQLERQCYPLCNSNFTSFLRIK